MARVEEAGRPALGHVAALHPRPGGLHLPAPRLELLRDRLQVLRQPRASTPARPAGSTRPRRRSAAWPARRCRAARRRGRAPGSPRRRDHVVARDLAHPLELSGLRASPAASAHDSPNRPSTTASPAKSSQPRPPPSSLPSPAPPAGPTPVELPSPRRASPTPAHEVLQRRRPGVPLGDERLAHRLADARPGQVVADGAGAERVADHGGVDARLLDGAERLAQPGNLIGGGRAGQDRDVERARLLVESQRAQVVGFVVGDAALGVGRHVDGIELERLPRASRTRPAPCRTRRQQQRRNADEEDAHDLSLPARTRYNLRGTSAVPGSLGWRRPLPSRPRRTRGWRNGASATATCSAPTSRSSGGSSTSPTRRS